MKDGRVGLQLSADALKLQGESERDVVERAEAALAAGYLKNNDTRPWRTVNLRTCDGCQRFGKNGGVRFPEGGGVTCSGCLAVQQKGECEGCECPNWRELGYRAPPVRPGEVVAHRAVKQAEAVAEDPSDVEEWLREQEQLWGVDSEWVKSLKDQRSTNEGASVDTNSKPMMGEKAARRQNLEEQLAAVRRENAALLRENERLQGQCVKTEREYKAIADTWNAMQAGLHKGEDLRTSMPKLNAKGEMARKLAEKLLRFVADPEDSEG